MFSKIAKKETVYILGAGFNQCVNDWQGLKPPLATNLFQIILKSEKYQTELYSNKAQCIYGYIKKYWKKSKDDLRNQPFDIEELFTLLESQFNKAVKDRNNTKAEKLATIFLRLTGMLAEFLSEFEIFSHLSDLLNDFAKKIYKEKPNIITFNWDCILETAIESASELRIPDSFRGSPYINGDITYDELPYSHFNWNRALAYGFEFDEVQPQRAGGFPPVDGKKFYSHPENRLYYWKILKLHGSLNWFIYLQSVHPDLEKRLSPDKQKNIILVNEHWHLLEPPISAIYGWYIFPLIITPILHKERILAEELFSGLWNQAKERLKKCSRLIVIGYSFPQTDSAVRKLLREAFKDNELDDLIVVNPDTYVAKIIKKLVYFTKPVSICSDLKEFLKM